MGDFNIGGKSIGEEEPTFVIAEAGSNHNGDLNMAKELVDIAADSGADAIKFQTFRANEMYVEDSGTVEYLEDERSIYEIIEDMEMPYEWIPELYNYCKRKNILLMSTPFDEFSVNELEKYVPAWKVASYTMSHHPFLRYIANTNKPVIMSTGAHSLKEVKESINVLKDEGVSDLAILQCSAAYPTPLEDINIRVIKTFSELFNVQVGLSDHTLDQTIAPTTAVALGATIIEKHFTIDKSLDGPDHRFALEPDELDEMVTAIRKTERALGTEKKEITEVESELHDVARRAIHAVNDIEKGMTLTPKNVSVLRPGKQENGLAPKHFEDVIGMTAQKHISKGAGIQWDHLGK